MTDDASQAQARQILAALSVVRRRGQWPLLQQLEKSDPDLAAYVMEELSAVHQTLLQTGAPPKPARRLQRQIQSLVLVVIFALRPEPPDSGGDPPDAAGPVAPDPSDA